MRRRHFTSTLVGSAAALSLPGARAQERAIKLLVGFPPGGSADVIARLLADKLRLSLGQPVVVENKPGAIGRIALAEVKRAAPDGQTLVLTPSGAMVFLPWLYQNIGYDPVKDFSAIARVSTFDFAVTVGPAGPPGDLKAVLAWMKANPDKANYATSGSGGVPHFTGLLIAQASGVPLTHIAYKGGAPAAQDLVAGQVPMMVDTATETIEHHRAGRVRIVAVTGEQRSRSLPGVPTLVESGVNVVADGYLGLYGPAGMPSEMVARLDRAVAEALRAPDMQEKIQSFGLVANHAGSAQLAAVQAVHYRRWEAPIKASGFKAE